METTAFWRKIWITITGQSKSVDNEDVTKVLNFVEKELCIGVLQYKIFTERSYEEWKAAVNLQGCENNLERFIHDLSVYLNLESAETWKVFCNFLMFEYCGRINEITQIAEYELFSNALFQHVWLFYSSERMFMIKTLKQVLENAENKKHRLNEAYFLYVQTVTLQHMRSLLMQQFSYLLNEIHIDNLDHCLSFNDWVVRNNHEQLEILQLIIFTIDYLPLSGAELLELLQLFKEHNFGYDLKCTQVLHASNPDDLTNIRVVEVSIFLMGLLPSWKSSDHWLPFAVQTEHLLLNLAHQGEIYVLMLAWATLHTTLPSKVLGDRFDTYYCQFTAIALKNKVFKSLYDMVSNRMFKESNIGKLVKNAVYVLLEIVCDKFDRDGAVVGVEYAAEALSELIKLPELAQRFFSNPEGGPTSIYKTAIEMFPCTFSQYTVITNELLKHPQFFKMADFNSGEFSYFTEEYLDLLFEDTVTLITDYRPYENKTIIIPAKSQAKVRYRHAKHFVTYSCSYSYFSILKEYINRNIPDTEAPEDMRNMSLGFTLINTIANSPEADLKPMSQCIHLVNSVHAKFTKPPSTNFHLVKICFDVFVSLIGKDIKYLDILAINKFLPDVLKDANNVDNYFDKNFLAPGTLLTNIREEVVSSSQGLLFSYINFLKKSIERNHFQEKVQVPAFVFLYLHVFPIHLDWSYTDVHIRDELTYECLQILFNVIKRDGTKIKNNTEKAIYEFCYRVITTYQPFLRTFMRLFRISNAYLHAFLEQQSDWNNIQKFGIIKTIKMSLNIGIMLFNLHNDKIRSLSNTTFLKLFFDTDTKPCIVKMITGFINHPYDIGIRKLSCQLLKKIAVHSNVPLLSLLELDHYQIQMMFLEKLRDPLEDEVIKVAILEFITVCINNQSGMTAAFFNVSNLPKTDNLRVIEGIGHFMIEYLENIEKSADYLNSPIQSTILDLFHTLWMYRKDLLISDLTNGEHFWKTLSEPLFRELKYSNCTYLQIFNIIVFELYKTKGNNDKMNSVLEKFFIEKKDTVKKWTDHILFSLDEPSKVLHGSSLLSSWKKLLVTVVKYYPKCLEDHKVRKTITQNCLDGLIQHFSYPDDITVLTLWSEIYLFLITQWPTSYYTDYKDLFSTHIRIFKYLGEYYNYIGSFCKVLLLSIAIKTVKDLRTYSHKNLLLVDEYLDGIGKIFDKEHKKMLTDSEGMNVKVDDKSYSSWVLLLIFGNSLLKSGFTETHPKWFQETQFLFRLTTSIELFIKNPLCFSVAKITVQCLINYARSSLCNDFLYIDFETFFDVTIPPVRYIYTEELTHHSATPWYFEEWWLTYTEIIQLNTLLLKKFGSFKLDVFFSFIYIHGNLLINSLKLPKVTVEKTALHLVSACLNFCYALLTWQQEWRLNHNRVFFIYMQTINQVINAIISIIIRPKMLKVFLIESDMILTPVEHIPLSFMVDVMNQLMEVLGFCNRCLIKCGPSLLKLIETMKPHYFNDVQIQYDFHVPKLSEEDPHLINYGSYLCILHFLCKTLSQITAYKALKKNRLEESCLEKNVGLVAFVSPNYVGDSTLSELYSSVQTFAASEISGLSAPWLTKLNYEKVNFALETLNTYLASEIFLTLYMRDLKFTALLHIKRELCSELLFFHEFIRKHMIEKYQYRILENVILRKVYFGLLPYCINSNDAAVKSVFARKSITDTSVQWKEFDPGDVNFEAEIFYLRDDFEGIYTYENVDVETEKWNVGANGSVNFGKQVRPNGKCTKIPIEKVLLKYPSVPEIVEGDYLLLLSHWYIYKCQLTY